MKSSQGRMNTFNIVTGLALRAMAFSFNHSGRLKHYMKNSDGWINFALAIATETGTVAQTIVFSNGRVKVAGGIKENVNVILKTMDNQALKDMSSVPPNEVMNMILRNRVRIEGNAMFLQLFNFYLSLLVGRKQQKNLDLAHEEDLASRKIKYGINDPGLAEELKERKKAHLFAGGSEDENVIYLEDPYLGEYDLEDFPRLEILLARHLKIRPALCAERPELLTMWYRENGFETDNSGRPWNPVLRQGLAFEFLMKNKKPVITDSQLLAGTTTQNPDCGVIVYPDAQGGLAWGELQSIDKRYLNPYDISEETREKLHDIFPFWSGRNFYELVTKKFNNPLGSEIDKRFVAYFCWKAVGLSHTIPDFRMVLNKGTRGMIDDINKRLADKDQDKDGRIVLKAMIHTLKGLEEYAKHLAEEAMRRAEITIDQAEKQRLLHMGKICGRVPRQPASTLDEAVQSIWTTWIAMHMENTNTGLSLGRLDQWLQPFFLSDMEKLKEDSKKKEYTRRAIELIGCFYLKLTDHMPLSPDIGNYLFGGSPADQAITLGGVTREGSDGVNDMTYIFLKVTEMLSLHDPNVNARINKEKNSGTYIRRLCEVNYTTSATPSMHNDEAVFASLAQHGYPKEDIRDWAAIGCVEPTISGCHCGHTGSILMNLVAGMEMALNNGYHPLMRWNLGPKTGNPEDFQDFEEFFNAYKAQQGFLIDQAIDLNNKYAELHTLIRPTPFLSSMMGGCIEKALDITSGGARYNSSGTSNIGLADIIDSLMAVKKLVFDEKKLSFKELKEGMDNDFKTVPKIRAMVRNKVPLFGSGSLEAVDMANKVTTALHDIYSNHKNYRGGKYTCGFWSMSQHVAYGNLSGALPSGRLKGKAFTPGLTPQPHASKNYLNFISDVAKLNPENMDNNIAFNVKLSPSAEETRDKIVDTMAGYVRTYCNLGGMQIQFNVVDSRVLKDAMANPENYRNLIVRISGYNAYFVSLNKEMQIELIERAEYGV